MKEISLRCHMVCIYNPADVRPQNARERQDQIWPRGMHKILPWLSVLAWQIENYLWHIVQILTHTWRPGTASHSSVSPSPLSAMSLTSSPPVSRRCKAVFSSLWSRLHHMWSGLMSLLKTNFLDLMSSHSQRVHEGIHQEEKMMRIHSDSCQNLGWTVLLGYCDCVFARVVCSPIWPLTIHREAALFLAAHHSHGEPGQAPPISSRLILHLDNSAHNISRLAQPRVLAGNWSEQSSEQVM